MKKYFLFTLLIILFSDVFSSVNAQETKQQSFSVTHWLTADPIAVKMPVFNEKNNLMEKSFHPVDLLKYQQKTVMDVKAGEDFLVSSGKKIVWENQDETAKISIPDFGLALKWQACYLQVNQFVPVNLAISSAQDFELYVNGKLKLSNYDAKGKEVQKDVSLKLEPGKYLVLIKSLFQKKDSAEWQVKAKISYDKKFDKQAINISTSNEQFLDIPHILLGKMLTNTQLSDDGSLVLLNFSESYPPDGKTVRWFEVKNTTDNKVIFSSLHSDLRQAEWVPGSHKITYLTEDGVSEALVCYNLDTHHEKVLMNKLERFSDYEWDHDGKYLIFSIREKRDINTTGVFMVRGMEDRWPWYRTRTQLFMLKMSDLSVAPLTYGYLTNQLVDISPDDQKILISQSFPDYTKRPYTKQVMMEMNLKTMKVDTLWYASFGGDAVYSPDGKQLLVTGSPSMFNGAGNILKKGKTPNDFDLQAYLFNLSDYKVTPLTKDFKPALLQSYWSPFDKQIYFLVSDRSYQDIWKLDPATKQFQKLKTHVDVINQMSFAANSHMMSYSGTSISSPATGWIYNLSNATDSEISNPEKSFFKNVKFGKTENWNFVDKQGWTIEGRIYYPPDYNPNKKYPLIVYYYGGTVPTTRDFGSRYPLNLFAAMGYMVYTLQPSGATGFGQKFSALHVNGWGKENARDIIDGVKKFVKSHPMVKANNIGCIGASYGGYMTLWLQTQTNIFKTAIDHAGISFIGSYWGQGYWGYSYSSVASANSFPWNNKKLYVDQSPLFHADKVHTPMLLLQGTADTNVPTGESIQFYTALKILGKPVEFVEIKGQNHHILDYKKRILWQKTIFAWFAKYLKNQPEWWNAMYPHKDL